MSAERIHNLEHRVLMLESRIEDLISENNRLKQVNRRLRGGQQRRGAPTKFVNILNLFGIIPKLVDKDIPAPRLVREERQKLQEFLGNLSDRSLENTIYRLRKKHCASPSPPIPWAELEEQLRDLL